MVLYTSLNQDFLRLKDSISKEYKYDILHIVIVCVWCRHSLHSCLSQLLCGPCNLPLRITSLLNLAYGLLMKSMGPLWLLFFETMPPCEGYNWGRIVKLLFLHSCTSHLSRNLWRQSAIYCHHLKNWIIFWFQ